MFELHGLNYMKPVHAMSRSTLNITKLMINNKIVH